jgi:hypothetical protein
MFIAALSIIVDKKSKVRGIGIRYRLDGGLFNLARLRTILKNRTCLITDLMYADDCALIARTPEQLQQILDTRTYTESYTALGLKLNKTKTKIMSIPHAKSNVQIQVYAHQLENVKSFDYLCSMLNSKANIDLETRRRIHAACRAFWRLRHRVFENDDLFLDTKTAVYRAVVIPTLLYRCETWVPYTRHIKELECTQQRHLCRIMRIRLFHRVSNIEVLSRAKCLSIEVLMSRSRLRWDISNVCRTTGLKTVYCIASYAKETAGKEVNV